MLPSLARKIFFVCIVPIAWATIAIGALAIAHSRQAIGSPAVPPPAVPPRDLSREAYVFLMTNDKHLRGLLAMHQGLRLVGSQRQRYAMVTPNATLYLREVLRIADIGIIEIPNPEQPPGYHPLEDRWRSVLSKIEIWALGDRFDRVVYIDVDATVNSNVDWLFDEAEDIATMQDDFDCWKMEPLVAGGLLSIRPDMEARNEMKRIIGRKLITKGDQEVIQTYISEVLHTKPKTYNESVSGFIWRCACMENNRIPRVYDYNKVRLGYTPLRGVFWVCTDPTTHQMEIVQFTGAHIDYKALAQLGIEGRWYTDHDCAIVHYKRWLETWDGAVRQMQEALRGRYISADLEAYLNTSVFV